MRRVMMLKYLIFVFLLLFSSCGEDEISPTGGNQKNPQTETTTTESGSESQSGAGSNTETGTDISNSKIIPAPLFKIIEGTTTSLLDQNRRLPIDSFLVIEAQDKTNIFYTTDGTTPTLVSTPYKGPISVSLFELGATHKLSAVAYDGQTSSEVAILNFVIPPNPPEFSTNVEANSKGYYAKGELTSVTIYDKENLTIYYSTNGQVPTTASSLYTTSSSAVILNQINNQNETLLKAISVKNGICSDVSTFSFKVAPKPTVNFLMENQSTTSPYRRGNMVFKTSTPKYLLSINGGEWKTYNSGTKINIKTLSKEQNSLTVRVTDENTLLANEKIFSISVDKDRTNPSKNLSCWMDWLDDNLPLQKLNIPGTHESGAWQAGGGAALCQSHGYSQQLANGIRVLDLRIHEDMAIYHGIFWQKHDLQFAMDEIKKFLANNPSEFLIVSIKDENGAGDQQTWTDNVNKVMASTGRLYTGNDYRVGALRGKFIIIRRFGYFNHGIRPGRWPNGDGKEGAPGYDESAHGTPLMRIQDRYGYSGFGSTQENDKKTKIDYLLNEAGRNPDDGILYISFISATGVPWKNPGAIAGVINPWFKEKLLIKKTEANNGIFYRWGVVMMDFITHFDHESVPGLYVNTNNFDAF